MRRLHKDGSDPSAFGMVMIFGGVVLGGLGLFLPVLIDSLPTSFAQPVTTGPVTVELVSPIAGSTVSNTIELRAIASSTAAPITKVEFYDTFNGVTKLIATVTNFTSTPSPPTGLRVATP